MLALDVDGRIADKGYSVPDRIKAAISDAISAGAVVSIATGRMRRSALRYAEECRTNGPTISYQGAVTTSTDGFSDIHTERLDPQTAASTLISMRNASAHINLYADDEIWVEDENEWATEYAVRMKTELRLTESLDHIASTGPTVVMAVDEPELIAGLAVQLRSELGADAAVSHSLPHFCEVASVRATKGHALARVSADYGFGPGEVIAIGDGEGDVSMIEWAGLGVASGAAHTAAKAAADLHIPGPDQCGVADLVQTLLSQGKLGR